MTDPNHSLASGWATAHASHLLHYFAPGERTSLCGRVLLRRFLKKGRNDIRRLEPQDCPECWQRAQTAGILHHD